MHSRIILGLVAVAVSAGGCTSSGSSPATAPPTTERVTTSTTPTPSTTSTTSGTTTTTIDRTAEIQAIFEDLEQRRLTAIRDRDEAAFRLLYANDDYLDRDLAAFEILNVYENPTLTVTEFKAVRLKPQCAAFEAVVDNRSAFEGGGVNLTPVVLEVSAEGWGYSWIGEGWQCVGPHPLSSP